MKCFPRSIIGALALLCPSFAFAQGTLPIALTQQFSFTNCATFTNACGTPLIGGAVYFYQAGTTSTPQNSYQDAGLSILSRWPLPLDGNGRVPMFYLASGTVHVTLRDVNGVTQFDSPNMLVIGPSGAGGGGSGGVDPTTVLSTGDMKFRPTGEFLTGWVKANGQTIGSAASGASQRANLDTQALFIYLWTNCAQPTANAHCPVLGGLGTSALADFNANKQLTVYDCRGRVCALGLDDMGSTPAGRIIASQVTSGGGDTVTTPNASGGTSQVTLTQAQLPNYALTVTDPGHSHSVNAGPSSQFAFNSGTTAGTAAINTTTAVTGITVNSGGGGQAANTVSPFMLGTWYVKL